MSERVIVIRKNTGIDILAVYSSENDISYIVHHPYYVKYESSSGHVSMAPYCAFTDDIEFSIKKTSVEFMKTANPDIAYKFLSLLNIRHAEMEEEMEELLEADQELDELHAAILDKVYVGGNKTKH